MSLERLVNGVLWPGFLGQGTPDWLRREADAGLAGVVLFAQNNGGGAFDHDGSMLVGIDEEGGAVTRLDAADGTLELGAGQLGALDDAVLTRRTATRIARRVALAGANVVIAPVADVNDNPANPVIGTRSFGSDPALVARHVAAAVEGIHDAGALAVPKHFPGHGDTVTDSHHGLAVSGASGTRQESVHGEPFRAAVAAGARMLMTGHVVVRDWGEGPATASPAVIARARELGELVIATDALDMAAMAARYGDAAGVAALVAGCDLLCIGNPANPGSAGDEEHFRRVRQAVVDAITSGDLSRARVEEAHERVAALRTLVGGGAGALPEAIAVPTPAGMRAMLLPKAIDACRTDGASAPLPGPRRVWDARAAATWAVSANGSRIARVVAGGGEVLRWDVSGTLAERPVLLVDRLGTPEQAEAVAELARRRPGGVVVNLGVAASDLPLAAVHTRAASRLGALAADAWLSRGW